MTLTKQSKIAAAFVISALIAAALIAALSINEVRIGGPLEARNRQMSDLLADVLPPPLYIIEPWLEVSLAAQHHGSMTDHVTRLRQLRRDYELRKAYWDKANVEPETRSELANAERSADQFWAVVDSDLMPALEHADEQALQATHDRLSAIYNDHRKSVDALVADNSREADGLRARSSTIATVLISIFALVMIAVIALVAAAARMLRKRVMSPLATTAALMHRMAGGDYAVALPERGRQDEIGDMNRAMEVFRATGIEKEAARVKQDRVVHELAEGLEQLEAGNLTFSIAQPFEPEYERLRGSFNQAVTVLDNSLRLVAEASGGVKAGATEIRVASEDLSRRTEQQAASLEETAAATSQVTDMVADSARNAGEISASIRSAHENATEGGDVVRRAVGAMDAIEKSSQEISNIVNLIDGIAFQTNLLALNAGVEAARAGSAGQGFAVVANEVRALAQRSADAAKDIKALITTSNVQVRQGVDLVGETGRMLEQIVTKIGEVDGLVRDMATGAEQQAVNVRQVNGSIGDMDKMTQQNAAMVEQATACSRTLATQADRLAELVADFRLSGSMDRAPIRATPAMTDNANNNRPGRTAVAGNLALKPQEDDWTEF